MSLNLWIIVSSIIFIVILWSVLAVRHLNHLRNKLEDQWELVDEGLRKRHDMIPNIIETIKSYLNDQGEIIKSMIEARENARRNYQAGAKKIEYEHELTSVINTAFALKNNSPELAKDTNFMELKREIDDLEQNLEDKVKKHNEMVRYYNKHRKILPLVPIAKIGKFKAKNIFEVEA
jgi:LemA protein